MFLLQAACAQLKPQLNSLTPSELSRLLLSLSSLNHLPPKAWFKQVVYLGHGWLQQAELQQLVDVAVAAAGLGLNKWLPAKWWGHYGEAVAEHVQELLQLQQELTWGRQRQQQQVDVGMVGTPAVAAGGLESTLSGGLQQQQQQQQEQVKKEEMIAVGIAPVAATVPEVQKARLQQQQQQQREEQKDRAVLHQKGQWQSGGGGLLPVTGLLAPADVSRLCTIAEALSRLGVLGAAVNSNSSTGQVAAANGSSAGDVPAAAGSSAAGSPTESSMRKNSSSSSADMVQATSSRKTNTLGSEDRSSSGSGIGTSSRGLETTTVDSSSSSNRAVDGVVTSSTTGSRSNGKISESWLPWFGQLLLVQVEGGRCTGAAAVRLLATCGRGWWGDARLEQQLGVSSLAAVQATGFRLQVRPFGELCRLLVEKSKAGGVDKGLCGSLEAGTGGWLGEMQMVELLWTLRVFRSSGYVPELGWVGAYALKCQGGLEGLKAQHLKEMLEGLVELGVYVPGGWVAPFVRELGTRAKQFVMLVEGEAAAGWAAEGDIRLPNRRDAEEEEEQQQWQQQRLHEADTLRSTERVAMEAQKWESHSAGIAASECLRDWLQEAYAVAQLLMAGSQLLPRLSSNQVMDQVLTDEERRYLERSIVVASTMVGRGPW